MPDRAGLPRAAAEVTGPVRELEPRDSSRGRPRVVLICHHDAALHHDGIARWLASWSELAGLVVLEEKPATLWRRVRRETRRVGWLRMLDVLAFRVFYRIRLRSADEAWRTHALRELRHRYQGEPLAERLATASPNSPESEAFIRERGPDAVIALCKQIIKPRVFRIPRFGTFVFHPGVCPEYRNAHGCFWALATRDLERVGMTLLRIDEGVDTGPIYGHFSYPLDERRESHIVIQNRVVLDNLDALRDALMQIFEGTLAPLDTSGRASRAWGQPWLTAWLRWKRAARRDHARRSA
jgi:hypothetical protein